MASAIELVGADGLEDEIDSILSGDEYEEVGEDDDEDMGEDGLIVGARRRRRRPSKLQALALAKAAGKLALRRQGMGPKRKVPIPVPVTVLAVGVPVQIPVQALQNVVIRSFKSTNAAGDGVLTNIQIHSKVLFGAAGGIDLNAFNPNNPNNPIDFNELVRSGEILLVNITGGAVGATACYFEAYSLD